ncbi:G-type lectin S-receptor-like serine/threonine-protein kinase At4g03230 [Fagus crenata]
MFILYILLLCSFPVYCAARDTLKFGERIEDNDETLVSAGGKFELGFFTPSGSSSDKRYVGIWYTWDKRTVVWVDRDDPLINGTGAFGFATDGNLKVWDTSSGEPYWSTVTSNYSCCTNRTVNLTDSGNLVLHDTYMDFDVWESFEHPTDTFLPGMRMDATINLTSWRDRDDPGSGNFTFMLENENTLVIYEGGMISWKTVKGGQFCISNDLYFDVLESSSSSSSSSLSSSSLSCRKRSEFNRCSVVENQRLLMNFSGKIEYWEQRRNENWSLLTAEPSNSCSVHNFCGKFGSCNSNNKLACKCLPGFMPNVPQKWHSGDFSDGCISNSKSCGGKDTFLSLKKMLICGSPERRPILKNESYCREECLRSCDCKSYLYDHEESSCWIWTQDLVKSSRGVSLWL